MPWVVMASPLLCLLHLFVVVRLAWETLLVPLPCEKHGRNRRILSQLEIEKIGKDGQNARTGERNISIRSLAMALALCIYLGTPISAWCPSSHR
jgi:hypothetical protein